MPTSKGPATAGTIADHRERGAVEGAGEVERAGDVGELGADAGAAVDRADLRVEPGRRGSASSARPVFAFAAAIWASGQLADAGELAEHAGRQGGVEAGQVLVAVAAGEAHVEGRVAPGGVVSEPALKARVEGRRAARRAGAAADAAGDLKLEVRGERAGVGPGGELRLGRS